MITRGQNPDKYQGLIRKMTCEEFEKEYEKSSKLYHMGKFPYIILTDSDGEQPALGKKFFSNNGVVFADLDDEEYTLAILPSEMAVPYVTILGPHCIQTDREYIAILLAPLEKVHPKAFELCPNLKTLYVPKDWVKRTQSVLAQSGLSNIQVRGCAHPKDSIYYAASTNP